MASAAMRLRAPDRQMKKSSVSLLAPAASSALVIRSAKPASILLSGHDCHSTVRTLFPIAARSGRPTNVHSALVRTSISAEAASFSSCAQTFSTGTSSMWTTSIDCTFVLHSRRPGWKCTSQRPAYRIGQGVNRITPRLAGRSPRKKREIHSEATMGPGTRYCTKPGVDSRWHAYNYPSRPTVRTVTLKRDLSKRTGAL